MKQMPVCDALLNSNKDLVTHEFCVPIFIANTFFGIHLTKNDRLIFDEYDEDSVRNGALTFVSYKEQHYAITCNHVLEALEKKQKAWAESQLAQFGSKPPIEGLQFFTPIGNINYHFNYKFSPVPKRDDGSQPDVAIARVKTQCFHRLNRKPILLAKKDNYPETGIASGYPEEQRRVQEGRILNTFSPRFVSCVATLQVTRSGGLLIEGAIGDHKGVNNLSGMSGGPIIWSDLDNFGLAGIVLKGVDIQPKEGQLNNDNFIWVEGELITPAIFDEWLTGIPELMELQDHTKMMLIPNNDGVPG